MIEREPSRTALAAATYRAAHQVFEAGRIFSDPLAVPILGDAADHVLANAESHQARRGILFFVVARSKLAEDELARAVEARGVKQVVVLGAGLDTFSYRNPFGDRLSVFEVDHPATQAWKHRRLREAGIGVPKSLTYVPVDFERENLSEQLARAGLDPDVRTYFMWLGVAPYLTLQAITSTLAYVAGHPGGAEVVFDYGEPRDAVDPSLRPQYERRAANAAAAGEPFLSFFVPAELEGLLRRLGFDRVVDLDLPAILTRLFGDEAAGAPLPRGGGHVLFASTALVATSD
ncbi:SAM-dependent methyltransferase [Caulobacter sp. 1776]|uniref:class I SAM-dependent methyltransferase n=1 Tax=Caulobacter sp. 1776 TaxID=3156420 RepID=UPI003390E6CA